MSAGCVKHPIARARSDAHKRGPNGVIREMYVEGIGNREGETAKRDSTIKRSPTTSSKRGGKCVKKQNVTDSEMSVEREARRKRVKKRIRWGGRKRNRNRKKTEKRAQSTLLTSRRRETGAPTRPAKRPHQPNLTTEHSGPDTRQKDVQANRRPRDHGDITKDPQSGKAQKNELNRNVYRQCTDEGEQGIVTVRKARAPAKKARNCVAPIDRTSARKALLEKKKK